MKHLSHSSYFFVIALVFALVLAACGGGASSATAIPTSTIIPTYSFQTRTPVAIIETAIATTVAQTEETAEPSALDPQLVERGKGRYDALQCADCHGANGEGTDKGSSLVTYTANEGDFIVFMRSGGTIGTSHQYSTNRLSESGGKALYQYLLSLRKS
ncbi:MAG: hypothetical protein GC179_12150 [Anaerolineaceae bacterium]|nr:hypothetical protein [Anaerolineaceae bacterium]